MKLLRSISQALSNVFSRIFGKNLTLEHKIFIFVAIAGIFMSTIGFWGNYNLGLSLLAVVIPLLSITVDVICIAYSILAQRWRGASVIVCCFAVFILFPFLWFTSGGAAGSTMPFIIMIGLIIVIIFKGSSRVILLGLTLLMFSGFILLEMVYPDIVIPYPSRRALHIDLLLGLVLSFATSVGLTYTVINSYQQARLDMNKLVEQLEVMSITDSLTEIYNRRFLTFNVDEEMRKSYDYGYPLTICIIDIDFFKKINDSYGHNYGDKVLVRISRTIAESLGPDEIFGRYGGEEFLIIFKNCTMGSALRKINKCRANIQKIQWEHGFPVTISCGVSTYRKGIHYSSFLENADENLYKAKANGRDQIVC